MKEIETRVQGIPCRALVEYHAAMKGRIEPGSGGAPIEPDEPASVYILDILDRRGRPAPWLARKMTERDKDRLVNETFVQVGAI